MKVNANRMRVLQNVYRTKNGIPTSQAVNLSDDAFTAFLSQRGYRVGLGYNAWGNVLHHGYHAIREEVKMKIAFDEHYHMGGGVAFYGTGRLLGNMIKSTKYNQLNSVINVAKSGTAGMVSVQSAHALESLVDDIAGNQTFMNAMREHYDFSEPWEEQAFVDFLVFSIIGIKGGKGLHGLKSTNRLYKLENKYHNELYGNAGLYNNLPIKPIYSGKRIGKNKKGKIIRYEIDWAKAKTIGADGKLLKPGELKKIEELEQKYNSTKDVHNALKQRLDVISKDREWNDPETAKRELDRTQRHVIQTLNKISQGKGGTGKEYVFEVTNDKELKADAKAGRKPKMTDPDAAAQLIDNKLIINTDYATAGKLPHEVTHIIFKELFRSNPIIAKQFKAMIKSSFKGKIYRGQEVIENGERTGEIKDMTLEEYIQNEYSGKGEKGKIDFERIEAEEYVAYVAELLAEGKHYGTHVGGNVFKDLMQGINRFSNRQQGKNIFGSTKSKKIMVGMKKF